jgi:AcrR family transcriptional regulator
MSVEERSVSVRGATYNGTVPRLWATTIETHRQAVRDATLDAAAALVAQLGLRGVTMSRIAEETGIGRATLYKYFPDVEAILLAWHERHVAEHLSQLAELAQEPGSASERLRAVLDAYALIQQRADGTDLSSLLHSDEHVAHAQRHLTRLVQDLIAEGAETGDLRKDVPPVELARYCLHALAAANGLPSRAAVHRLMTVTLSGLRQ